MAEMTISECVAPAKVVWGISLSRASSVEEWMPYESSDIDWLVSTTREALDMLDAADRIATARAGYLRAPKLEIVVDEADDLLGYEGTDPDRKTLRTRITSLTSAARPSGVIVTGVATSPASTSPESG